MDNFIVLRSVYGKVGFKYYIQPTRNPLTGRYPDCVKAVNAQGDMILTDAERNSGDYFIPETSVFEIVDGKTFNLDNEIDKKQWEAIKHCSMIAPERFAKDRNGNYLIDGVMDLRSKSPKYGKAELYVDRPGLEVVQKVTRKKLVRDAVSFIFDDEKGAEGRLLMTRLLGKNMSSFQDADVTDYLLDVAEKNPEKIINLYTGDETSLRLLFMDARDRNVIYIKNKLFFYADDIMLGASDDAVIAWMKEARNKRLLDLIKKDVYPDLYSDDELEESEFVISETKDEQKTSKTKK